MNERTPAIEIRGLVKSFGENRVLTGVDLAVAQGTIFALLGSNGAGKTTIVKILSTLLKADAGTATVNGFDVATQAAKVRESISLTGQFAAVDEILRQQGWAQLTPSFEQVFYLVHGGRLRFWRGSALGSTRTSRP